MPEQLSPSEQLAHSTMRIECETSSGGSSVGTGFWFQFELGNNRVFPVIITNKHVIENSVRGIFHLTHATSDGDPDIGHFETVVLDNFRSRWLFHPSQDVDLCAMPIGPLLNQAQKQNITFFYRTFGNHLMADVTLLSNLNALEEIVMVGYPVGIWDASNNLPVFRSGTTATHPNIDYNGRKEFLIDCACFPGSSGSPVLLYNFGNYRDRKGNTVIGTRIALLGVLYAGPQFTVEGNIKVVEIPTQKQPVPISRIPTNLGLVIKAEKISDFEPLVKKLGGSA